jgi:uncharacterized RDD family membrane protein YckC
VSTISAGPASLWQRVKAFAFDYLLIAGYLILIVGLGVGVNVTLPRVSQTLFANRVSGQVISFLLVTLPVILYYALLESSPQQATWGKRKIGLRVIETEGARLKFLHALARTLLKFVPWELSHTLIWQLSFAQPETTPFINAGFVLVWLLIGANLLSLWLSKKHQTLYDRLSATYVVRPTTP